jgi:hypothetical protein
MMHKPQPVTTNEHGDETHPAFGSISVSRIRSTPGAVLFDSGITHSEFIRVAVSRMSRQRDLKRDWLHADSRDLIEVDMSLAQWGAFVSAFNTTGVPCTIRKTETDWNIPGLEFDSRLAVSAQEARNAAHEAFGKIREAMAAVDALDPKAGIKDRRKALDNLRHAIQGAPASVEFAATSLTEHVEDVVAKARADVEAMVVAHAERIGLDPQTALGAIAGPQVGEPAQIEEGVPSP